MDLTESSVDAIVLDERDAALSRAKLPAGEPASSLRAALAAVTGEHLADPRLITRAVLGSSAALDALEGARELRRVAVLRVGGPLTLALRPLATWPAGLRSAAAAGETVVGGGADYDGRPAGALDTDAISRFLGEVGETAAAVAITGVFSSVSPEHELEAAALVHRELGVSVCVSLSHEVGSVGLLERENATVLNAALGGVVERLAESFSSALELSGIDAELFFAKGDGTVMTLEHAARFPVFMLGSGFASAIRGAAWLSGVVDGVMLDVGASTTRVGTLVGGRPAERSRPTDLGGVRTNMCVPESVTLGLGGGTVLELDDPSPPVIGEESVGGRVGVEALVFGGSTPTLIDAAVAGGRGALGTHVLSTSQRRTLKRALPALDSLIHDAIQRSRHALPGAALVVFGGGAILVPERIAGVSDVIAPDDGDVAGAVGLLVAPAGGQADRICVNRPSRRATTIEAARDEAIARAVHAGADPGNVHIAEIEEVPLSYLPDPPIRITVKAIGSRI